MESPEIKRPPLSKIPGELPKMENEKRIENLKELDKPRLLEIKQRQEQILNKK